MDDLSDLQARVAAAQEKLRLNADDQRKYGLRLNDVVTIVEGSLARQQDEMKRLQDAAVSLRLERDATKVAENQTKGLYEAALVRLNLLQAQNEQLRNMVMTLLNVIEGRESASALQGVLVRLESSVKDAAAAPALVAAETIAAAELTAEEPVSAAAVAEEAIEDAGLEADEMAFDETAEPAAEPAALADESESAEAIDATDAAAEAEDEMAELETPAEEPAQDEPAVADMLAEDMAAEDDAAEDEIGALTEEPLEAAGGETAAGETVAEEAIATEAADGEAADGAAAMEELDEALSEDMPEDLGNMAMNGHRDIVTDADALVAGDSAEDAMADDMMDLEEIAPAAAKPVAATAQDETLVSALLDAEKALIEAGASGVANINSPVAEIIRRISLRTREFSEASGS